MADDMWRDQVWHAITNPGAVTERQRVTDAYTDQRPAWETLGEWQARAVLVAVEAHVRRKQAEAWDEGVRRGLRTADWEYGDIPNADELDPRPEEAATGARWCGCAWCCAGNAPGLQPGSAHDICTTNRRPEEDHG